jgi:hypothetical protein
MSEKLAVQQRTVDWQIRLEDARCKLKGVLRLRCVELAGLKRNNS